MEEEKKTPEREEEQALPVQELPTDIPAEVRQKLAEDLNEDYMDENHIEHEGGVDGWSQEEMKSYIDEHDICCPKCGKKDFTDIRQFKIGRAHV